jgi:chaperonin GroEL (HSP60 family)
MEAGIIDPTKVARTALENAVSVASMLADRPTDENEKDTNRSGAT